MVGWEAHKIADKNIPNKYVQIRSQDPPWMTSHIRRTIRKKKRFHKKAKKLNTPEAWQNFKQLRNESVNLVKKAKTEYFDKQASLLNSDDISIKNWWKILSNLAGRPSKSSDYPLYL